MKDDLMEALRSIGVNVDWIKEKHMEQIDSYFGEGDNNPSTDKPSGAKDCEDEQSS
ncbi:MAG: hypothetical protein ACRCZ2_00660 [Fusobacteriaceae bacterium]